MIRNSLKYIPYKYSKEFVKDLKNIYEESTETKAESAVLVLEEKWGRKYALSVKPWITHCDNLTTHSYKLGGYKPGSI